MFNTVACTLAAVLVAARIAQIEDLPVLEALYRLLEEEMTSLHPMWPRADGLAEPVDRCLVSAVSGEESMVVVGEVDGFPLGFALARLEEMHPQAGGELLGSIRLMYTVPEAREIGVAETMRDFLLESLRGRGITKFDAHVLPGHRLAKNFFEAGGFSARSIIMHHDDHPLERPGRDPRRF